MHVQASLGLVSSWGHRKFSIQGWEAKHRSRHTDQLYLLIESIPVDRVVATENAAHEGRYTRQMAKVF